MKQKADTDKKNSKKKKVLKGAGIAAGACVLLLVCLLLVLTVTEYKPEAEESLAINGTSSRELHAGSSISVLSWNIGYGALGDNADFFMDGGSHVNTASSERVEKNLAGIAGIIQDLNPDLLLLQEVDLDSKRSCHINEQEEITSRFDGFQNSFAYNYKVLYVPYPFPTIGKVECGLCTLSPYETSSSTRVSLPCPFQYPIRLCNLKRCLMVNRIPVNGTDKELVLVNLHLEAYDSGEGKIAQTAALKELLEKEAEAGNYVIAGGDFNQTFSNTDISMYPATSDDMWRPGIVDTKEFSESLTFLMDNSLPSCRSLDQPYKGADRDGFQYYLIDGFIVSDNITVQSMKTLDFDFEHTDHNPILLKAALQ